MPIVYLRFYGPLNDFLARNQRQQVIAYPFLHKVSVKDVIEALGVPHPEVSLLLVNGESVDFGYWLADEDLVSVYPPFFTTDTAAVSRVQYPLPEEYRFILDVHLGKLAVYLRMLGFDTWYKNQADDADLARLSDEENRILLTRDRGLLMRSRVRYGYFVRHTNPERQLAEIVGRYSLSDHTQPFTRCLNCNGLLAPVAKEAVLAELPPHVRETQQAFQRCPNCGKVYWEGTHYRRMQAFVARNQ